MKTILGRVAAVAASGLAVTATASVALHLAKRSGLLGQRFRPLALDGRVVVVCGASRGLGLAMAREFLRRGAKVAICGRSADSLDQAVTELTAIGDAVFAEACDLRSHASTRSFLDRVSALLGPIDVLVANAATIDVGPIASRNATDFRDAMRSTFDTALHPALAVVPAMRARREGTIAFITSIGGKIGVPHLAPYSAAKYATVGFANALRAEIAEDQVHVLTVVPGLMRTGSHLRATFKGAMEKELAWFGASATMPLVSIDADRAAKRIVDAIENRDCELVMTLPARIAARTHDLAPGVWSWAMATIARMLPEAPDYGGTERLEGETVLAVQDSPAFEALRKRSAKLAARFGQLSRT